MKKYGERRNLGNGAPSTIRTCDLLIRSQTLYPAELWVRVPDILISESF